jgi:hypothetical protein
VEFNLTQLFADIRFYDIYGFETGHEYQAATSPSVALIGDNTLYGYFGPVNGHRYNLTYSPAVPRSPTRHIRPSPPTSGTT